MTTLSDSNISIIKFHFNQTRHATVNYGDSLTKNYSSDEMNKINAQIGRCEAAFAIATLSGGSLVEESSEVRLQNNTSVTVSEKPSGTYTTTTTYGDRTKTVSKRASYRTRVSAYYNEVEILAKVLGVEI